MAFEDFENSNYGGTPVVLYQFSRGAQNWFYTDADQDIVRYINRFVAYPISNAGITQSGEPSQDDVTVTMPWDSPVVALFRGIPPALPVYLRIYRRHATDIDDDEDTGTPLVWMGTVGQVRRTKPGTAEITCNTLVKSFERNGVRLGWTRTCPYALYDPATCKADKSLHATLAEITSVTGVAVVAAVFATLPAGTLSGGFIEWLIAPDTYERRTIEIHAGDTLTLLGSTDGLEVGSRVTAFAGCDRTVQTCNDKFNNLGNNGSAPTLPGRSPFDGNPVF
jgi:uncharacterized phage protein (TIGR02218 family)